MHGHTHTSPQRFLTSGRPSSPLLTAPSGTRALISTGGWLGQLRLLPRNSQVQHRGPVLLWPLTGSFNLHWMPPAEAKPISMTFKQRKPSKGLAISSEHILNITLTPKIQAYGWKKSWEFTGIEYLISSYTGSTFCSTHLTSSMFMTWQMHPMWHSRGISLAQIVSFWTGVPSIEWGRLSGALEISAKVLAIWGRDCGRWH